MKKISFLPSFSPSMRQSSIFWVSLLGLMTSAVAQFKVDVAGVGLTQVPVAIAPFKGEDLASQKPSAIVFADLERSGQFKAIGMPGVSMDELSRPDFPQLRQKSADALLSGSTTRLADGRFELRARLWDVVSGQERGGHQP